MAKAKRKSQDYKPIGDFEVEVAETESPPAASFLDALACLLLDLAAKRAARTDGKSAE